MTTLSKDQLQQVIDLIKDNQSLEIFAVNSPPWVREFSMRVVDNVEEE